MVISLSQFSEFYGNVSVNNLFQSLYFHRQISTSEMTDEQSPMDIWRQAHTVCFDVDSTLIQDEGLDELANFCGVGKVVKEW